MLISRAKGPPASGGAPVPAVIKNRSEKLAALNQDPMCALGNYRRELDLKQPGRGARLNHRRGAGDVPGAKMVHQWPPIKSWCAPGMRESPKKYFP